MNKNMSPEQHIHGIHCDVSNCVYHDKTSMCTAKEIKVGPQYASSSADTVCATFRSDTGIGMGAM